MSIPSWAVNGAKVVCVKDTRNAITLAHPHPVKGAIYTIRKVVVDSLSDRAALLLEEIVLTEWLIPSELEPGFNINGFKPLVTRTQEQDIAEHFRDLLRTPEVVE